MKIRTAIILWVTAIALGILCYFIKFNQNNNSIAKTKLKAGQKLIPNLPTRDISRVTLTLGDFKTELVKLDPKSADSLWGVSERNQYPADQELLRKLLGSLGEIKVSQAFPCIEEHYHRFSLLEKSEKASQRALHITMYLPDGSEAAELYLGKLSGGQQTAFSEGASGRYVRLANDDSGVYTLGEIFPGIGASPENWLKKDFLIITQLESVELSAPNDTEFRSYKIQRSPQNTGLEVSDLASDEVMKLTSTNGITKLFNTSSFIDVLNEERFNENRNPDTKLTREALIKTTEGFNYKLSITPEKEASNTCFISIQTTLNVAESDANKTKLAEAKKLEGHYFKISKSIVGPLLLDRSNFVSKLPK